MTEVQATTNQIPVSELITMLTAISERNYTQFQQLENAFVSRYGIEVWQEFFNFRLLPGLDKLSSNWLLVQFCSAGIVSVKKVAN
ncbi:MAG: hypothetical protein PUP92_35025 [Rhizonema sp. PD38]|nr:hypothetical protein [Rhizonema sp. PD38]